MSYYTSDIKTHEIQAYTNSSNFRTEFRLDANRLYMSNMRLMNVGWVQSGVNRDINRLVGSYGVIKSLNLFDDNELIDGLDNFNLWAAFNCYNKKNDSNLSTNEFLKNNNMGLVSKRPNDSTAAIDATVGPVGPDRQSTNVENTTPKSWLDVSAYLNFLQRSRYIPSHYFKRLRLVIEYETDILNLTPADGTDAVTSLEPFLVVDEMVNEQVIMEVMKNYGGIQYQPLETSRVVMPSITPKPSAPTDDGKITQEITFTIQGFNNKSINRLVMMPVGQSPQTSAVSSKYGKLQATSIYLNNYQVRTAEGNLLQGQGLTTDNQRRAMLTDLYGDCDDQVGAVWISNASSAIEDATNTLGYLSPFAVKVEQSNVQNFQVTVGRKAIFDTQTGIDQALTKYNQTLHLHFFAETQREIRVNPKDMSYSIAYV
jgi:hypothetical protein